MVNKKDLSEESTSLINLAIEKPYCWFLTDDDKAILYALNIGLNVMSTVKVIIDAAVEGELEYTEELVKLLYELNDRNDYQINEEMICDIVKVAENLKKHKDNELTDFDKKYLRIIEKLEDSNNPRDPFSLSGIQHGYGWLGLTLPIIEEVRLYNNKHPRKNIYIGQIKEKFGCLRIYLTGAPDYIEKMIQKAEYESVRICEICGAKGKTVKIGGMFYTVCEDHRKAKKESNRDSKLEDRLYRKYLNKKTYPWETRAELPDENEKSEEEGD
ncbi:MAG: hypothetical protein FWB86_09090 [Treponema sp.]|nr:hypothetical protein [Treponema sp.]MCL2272753.1 hypothetical protein [Treponema sp.]